MNVNQYVKTMRGTVSKDEVLNSLEAVIQDLNTKVLPIVDTAAASLKTIKFKSPEVIGYDERYRNELKVGRGGSIFVDLQTRLHEVNKNLNFMRDAIERTLPEQVAQSNIDYRSAMLMQLVDNASFMMRFIRRFIEVAVVYETQAGGMYEDYQKNNLTKGEAQWVETRFVPFITVLETLSDSPAHFKSKFEDVPNIKVDVDTDDDLALFGRGKMDPFKMGFIPVSLNPFFHIGKWIAEFQAWRYKEAQEDLVRIQKRILLLEEANSGKGNPKIEKEIEILRDKSESLIYKINKAEEDL